MCLLIRCRIADKHIITRNEKIAISVRVESVRNYSFEQAFAVS